MAWRNNNMKKQLAIIGHETRGKEVIGILETLGAINKKKYIGNDPDALYILNDDYIDLGYDYDNREVYTLEQFLRKYPFKIGDRVINSNYDCYGIINEMVWDSNDCCVKYSVKFEDIGIIAWLKRNEITFSDVFHRMDNIDSETCKMTHKDAPNKICRIFISDKDYQDKVELCLDNDYEVVVEGNKTFVQRKKPKYPTTYEECCGVLGMTYDYPDIRMVSVDEYNLYSSFIELIRCRDAYWKIADNWKPDWKNDYQKKWIIDFYKDEVKLSVVTYAQYVLSFPTEEMCDKFFENFKGLIEKCKKLL